MKFSIIISNTKRSEKYIDAIIKKKYYPNEIIYLHNKKNLKFFKKIQKKFKFFSKIKKFNSLIINKNIGQYILRKKEKYFIYSGYPGVIVKDSNVLKNKNLIHFHPGKLPKFKGSTTIYYGLLVEKKIHCTTLRLNQKIDEGNIIQIFKYPIPKDIKKIDNDYDDYIRVQNLIKFLNSPRRKLKKTSNSFFSHYYVIHPVLRSMVFKKFNK